MFLKFFYTSFSVVPRIPGIVSEIIFIRNISYNPTVNYGLPRANGSLRKRKSL